MYLFVLKQLFEDTEMTPVPLQDPRAKDFLMERYQV